jgi:hypothetical protein
MRDNRPDLILGPGEILVLRTCSPDGTSYGGFRWPLTGPVECPDWEPTDLCGHGLHGLPWGVGAAHLLSWVGNNGWVVRVDTHADYRAGAGDLTNKCKFRAGVVVLAAASREECVALIQRYAPPGLPINWSTATAGDWGTATAGDQGTATAGYGGTATAGDQGTATAGDWGTATAGYGGTATAGDWGTATAGNGGTATAGDWGTATAGYGGTATAGDQGTATAGDWGIVAILHWDGSRYVRRAKEIGPDDAGKAWYLNERGEFVVRTKEAR